MTKKEVIELVINTKGISTFTRNAIEWFYKNEYLILSPREVKFYNKKLEILGKIGGEDDWFNGT